ncbi:hypothetical protein FA13DRAFT_29335 [Coprinellus micaceus]|uniref:Uncharacterized protein n=1 Tax=Coprinellus micaceus TaxID=71717 RepID=A0A4Y7U056_COPMI|nr:hypothetical protein FA13DRAFT_29335 [Coprinellus micaceus]
MGRSSRTGKRYEMVLPGDPIYQSVGSSHVMDEEQTSRGRATMSIRGVQMERAADSFEWLPWGVGVLLLCSMCFASVLSALLLPCTLLSPEWHSSLWPSLPCFQLLYLSFAISQLTRIRLLLHDTYISSPATPLSKRVLSKAGFGAFARSLRITSCSHIEVLGIRVVPLFIE